MPAYPLYLVIRAVSGFAGACAFTLNLVYQLQVAGLGPLQLIVVGTTLELVSFLAQVPTGVIADLYSRRASVVVGYLLIGSGILIEGLVPAFAAILFGNVLWGVGATCVDGAEEAWAAGEIGEERAGDAFTRGAQVGQAATVVGVVAAVGLASIALSVPIVVGAVAWLLLAGLLLAVMPERRFRPAPRTGRPMRAQVTAGARAVRHRPALLWLFGAVLFLGLGTEGLDRLWQAHLVVDVGFPAAGTPVLWFGALTGAAMVGSIALTEVLRRRLDTLDGPGAGRAVTAMQALFVAAVVAFALAGQFWAAAGAYLLVGLLRSASQPLLTTWLVAQTEPATRATVLSMAGQVDAVGQIAGGPPVGLVGERLSIRAALLVTAGLAAPAVGLLAAALRRPAPAPRSPVAR